MACTEPVEFRLTALSETGQPVLLPQCLDTVTTTGQDLVRIGLMADIPYQSVMGRLEDVMKRHCQLDNAKADAKKTTRLRHRANGRRAQLSCEILEVALGQAA